VTQHARLSPERWARFDLGQQVLMIANEMNRGAGFLDPAGLPSLRRSYERVLRLVDLTVATHERRGLRRELLRWRDLVAALYVAPVPEREAHAAAFRCLLQLHPRAAKQIPHVLSRASSPR
jgi:hypothetical protein